MDLAQPEGLLVQPALARKPLSTKDRWKILFYLSALIVMTGFGAPYKGLIDVPISFFLKNKLHLAAHEVADFRLIAAIPLYLSFIFGFIRDTCNPFGMKDRGFLVIFGIISAAVYAIFALVHPSYATLLIATLLLTTSFLFVSSAQNGLTSLIGQQHVMTGQISAIFNVFDTIPVLTAFFLGGLLSENLEGQNADLAARNLFLIGAAIMTAVAIYGMWKPRAVFSNIHAEKNNTTPLADLKRLVGHWPIYPALLIWLLWNFAPGGQTPLQFYLQNTLHASDTVWGEWNAIFAASFIPTFVLFGFLCRKFSLKNLLWWGTIVAIPQFIPLLFIHSVTASLIAAALIGLMGGVASAAYIDLIIRSCPSGMQGTTLMMAWSLYYVASRFGDVLGTTLYDRYGGFSVCVLAITVVYALILPVLLLIPKHLIATADGEISRNA